MISSLTQVTLVVKDQETALRWYTEVLGLEKRTDRQMGKERWLSVGVRGQAQPEIILQQPSEETYGPETYKKKMSQIGQNATWIFGVDDCATFVESLRQKGTTIVSEPEQKPWGTSALIADLYGNIFNLVQMKPRG